MDHIKNNKRYTRLNFPASAQAFFTVGRAHVIVTKNVPYCILLYCHIPNYDYTPRI